MIDTSDSANWSECVRQRLRSYDESLLRQVAAKLIRPRSQWPVEELIERCANTLENAPVIDRRLEDLEEADRRLLAVIGHSQQPHWRLGNLLEILAALGHNDGPEQIFRLFEAGLLYPDFHCENNGAAAAGAQGHKRAAEIRLKNFEQWLGQAAATNFTVFACPTVVSRAIGTDLGLAPCPSQALVAPSVHEADGLEWQLRLAALWQVLSASPLRCTQSGEFFKRDLDRLRDDSVLNSSPADGLADLPDPALLAVALGRACGIVKEDRTDLRAGTLPADWEDGSALTALWKAMPFLDTWNPREGWCGKRAGPNPYASAYLLALLLLSRIAPEKWAKPADIEDWILQSHPFWREDRRRPSKDRGWMQTFLLGFAYQLRILQAAKGPDGEWHVRLSPWGRCLLGLADRPAGTLAYQQTLLVQPNHEIVVYRQGLTASLIARLSQFAIWKSLGAACTLQLQADQVYRALESGLTVDDILRTLEQHSSHGTPPAVSHSLRTWAGKRERISVYSSATLFEFGSPEDLNDAMTRGVAGIRLSDRLLAVVDEGSVDFRHFRLTGTRDYSLPPEKCVDIEPDGVTLAVDVSKSDLLLEAELQRFAEPLDGTTVNGFRRYRLTPASLTMAREHGFGPDVLEEWFQQRAAAPPSAATVLIQSGNQLPALQARPLTVLQVPSALVADGLEQWPSTRSFIKERLGPTALVIDSQEVEALQERLRSIGITLQMPQSG
jgi:hypothetical protein